MCQRVKTKAHKQNYQRDCPRIWGGFCLCAFLPHKERPEKKKLPPTQSWDNPANLFMFMCFSLLTSNRGKTQNPEIFVFFSPRIRFCEDGLQEGHSKELTLRLEQDFRQWPNLNIPTRGRFTSKGVPCILTHFRSVFFFF